MSRHGLHGVHVDRVDVGALLAIHLHAHEAAIHHLRSLVTARTRVLVTIDPNNPTGAVYPVAVRRALLDIADEYGLTILADEVYGELGFDGPIPLLGTLDRDAAVISLSSLSKAYLPPGWRAGWAARTPRAG